MLLLALLAALAQTGPSKPQHLLQCEDAQRLVEALVAAGVAQPGQAFSLPQLSCGVAGGPPGSERFSCSAPALRGESARRVWDALAAARLQAVGATMSAVFVFSAVRCGPSELGLECALTNEMRDGVGDLRGERVVKRRTKCGP